MGSDRIEDMLWLLRAGEFAHASGTLLGMVDRRTLSSCFISDLMLPSENLEARVDKLALGGLESAICGEPFPSEGDLLDAVFGLLLAGIMDSLSLLSSVGAVEELRSTILTTDRSNFWLSFISLPSRFKSSP